MFSGFWNLRHSASDTGILYSCLRAGQVVIVGVRLIRPILMPAFNVMPGVILSLLAIFWFVCGCLLFRIDGLLEHRSLESVLIRPARKYVILRIHFHMEKINNVSRST